MSAAMSQGPCTSAREKQIYQLYTLYIATSSLKQDFLISVNLIIP